jgi:hypothetical protein
VSYKIKRYGQDEIRIDRDSRKIKFLTKRGIE